MKVAKYIRAAKITWESMFVYRLNFIMWRIRNIVQIVAIYFLWSSILSRDPNVFGYSTSQMLTYILGTSLMRALVFSSRSIDTQSEISSGDLNNYLIKPLDYFKYWFSRDLADKFMNLLFSAAEVTLLVIWLKPPIFIQSDPLFASGFILVALLAMVMYFYFSFLISMTTFWIPEGNGWPQRFLVFVTLEFFSGGLFPLDILPPFLATVVSKLPSAYFLHVPLQIYLGRTDVSGILTTIMVMFVWIVLFKKLADWVFERGLRIYGAYGR